MKYLLWSLNTFLFSISAIAQAPKTRPLGTDFSYAHTDNDFWFYLYSEFAFGSGGGGGPKITGFLSEKSNDTLYIKALYNVEGVWAGWYSYSKDTIAYTRTDMSIRYFNISTNIYYYNDETGTKTDTAWNERDTTFIADPTGFTETPASIDTRIFPNPAKDKLQLQGADNAHSLSVSNGLGQWVIDRQIYAHQSIDIRNLQPGLYFLHLYDREGISIAVFRFYKQG